MLWMALIAMGLVAGVAIINDDDDDTAAVDEPDTPDTGGGTGQPVANPFEGTTGDNEISGTAADNVITGRNGDDVLNGRGGADRLFGDGGFDTLDGGNGADSVYGGNGDDMVQGGRGGDLLRGGEGADLLLDGTGKDIFFGDTGNDVIISSGFLDAEQTAALAADPALPDGVANVLDTLQADLSQDTDAQADLVNGGYGDDLMLFGHGDTVTGGEGADTFLGGAWLEGGETAVITDFDPGEDRLLYGYDPANGEPELSLLTQGNSSGGTDAVVMANGAEVLRIAGQGGTFDLDQHLALIVSAR